MNGSRRSKCRIRILRSAQELFFTRSFGAVSIEEIAGHAKVSKVTVYNHFRDKTAILQAAVFAATEDLRGACPSPHPASTSLEEDINILIAEIRTLLWNDRYISMNKGVSAEIATDELLRSQMLELLLKPVLAAIRSRLDYWSARGMLHIGDDELAAEQLFALGRGMMGYDLLFGARKHPDPTKDTAPHASLFIRAYGRTAQPHL